MVTRDDFKFEFGAVMRDLIPNTTISLEMRLAMEARGIVGEMLDALGAQIQESLKKEGYRP